MRALTTSQCDISGNKIAYFRKGQGDPVLLVHGITTYSFIWKRIVPLLESDYEVIGIDLLGCGASSKALDQAYSITNHAHILKRFMESLGISKFHFVFLYFRRYEIDKIIGRVTRQALKEDDDFSFKVLNGDEH